MTEPTDALAPCPFCGSAASLHNDTDSPCWFVGCSNSACPIEPHHYADTEVEAIATWNRRTPAPVGVETITPFISAQRERLFYNRPENIGKGLAMADWHRVVQYVEAAHGIGIKGGQHGTNT